MGCVTGVEKMATCTEGELDMDARSKSRSGILKSPRGSHLDRSTFAHAEVHHHDSNGDRDGGSATMAVNTKKDIAKSACIPSRFELVRGSPVSFAEVSSLDRRYGRVRSVSRSRKGNVTYTIELDGGGCRVGVHPDSVEGCSEEVLSAQLLNARRRSSSLNNTRHELFTSRDSVTIDSSTASPRARCSTSGLESSTSYVTVPVPQSPPRCLGVAIARA